MNMWISIIIIGLLLFYILFVNLVFTLKSDKNIKPVFLIGIFLPLILSCSYAEYFVFGHAFTITLIDLAELITLGVISGVFIACYFLIDEIQSDWFPILFIRLLSRRMGTSAFWYRISPCVLIFFPELYYYF